MVFWRIPPLRRLVLASMLCCCSLELRGDDDTTPLSDRPAQKTGFLPQLELSETPVTVWSFVSPLQGQVAQGLSDPATSGGMLFFGDDSGVVRAVTAREGRQIWKHEHGERVFFRPYCDGQRLFVATRKGLTALECSSGIKLWSVPVKHSVGSCVAWRETETVFFADSEGFIYALDAVQGNLKWKSTCLDDAPADPPGFKGQTARFEGTAARPTGIATDGQCVYQSLFDQCRVVAYDCATGKRQASYQTRGWVYGDPAVDQQALYVGSQDQHLYCFDRLSGEVLWTAQTGARIESGPGLDAQRVIVGSCDGKVYCWNKRSGVLLWSVATAQTPGAIYSAPIVTRTSVFLAAAEGSVYALDIETGKIRWQHCPSDSSHLYSSPATDGTRIFIKSRPQNARTGVNAIFAIGPAEGPEQRN